MEFEEDGIKACFQTFTISPVCHSERSEESRFTLMISRLMPWILRYTQDDKPVCIHSLVAGLHCLKSRRQIQERVVGSRWSPTSVRKPSTTAAVPTFQTAARIYDRPTRATRRWPMEKNTCAALHPTPFMRFN